MARIQLRIGQEREGKAVLLFKALVRRNAVLADAEHDGVFFRDLRIALRKAAGLFGTACRLILGVEVQDHALARVVAQ